MSCGELVIPDNSFGITSIMGSGDKGASYKVKWPRHCT
ncbi:Uncharacterised protein [Vibrio cholerae]|nr:Uncharacterised protein [Vibrio cholerae]